MIRGPLRAKRMDFLIKTSIPWELLQAACESHLEAHDRQERLPLQEASNVTP
jgi:hypothetical protein